jgi:Syntaxin 6, N-terminal
MEDPYYEARDAVGEMVEGLRAQHERLQDLVRSKTSTAAQVKEVRRSLVMDIRAVDKEFKVLKGSVANVEQNRGKYPAIKEGELEARKAFINETLKTLKAVKTGVESEAVKRKLDEDDSKARRDGMDETYAALAANVERNNSKFVEDQQLYAKEMINIQDEALEALGQGVDRLNDMGTAINVELKEQDKMLGGLGSEMEEAEGKMNMVNHYLNKLLKTKDGCQYGTILVLAIILVVLVAVVIWVPSGK